jgi:hypothetical protein
LLQHAVQPLHTSKHNSSFTHFFRDHFPDPENIFHSLHAKLWDEEGRGTALASVPSSKSECATRGIICAGFVAVLLILCVVCCRASSRRSSTWQKLTMD